MIQQHQQQAGGMHLPTPRMPWNLVSIGQIPISLQWCFLVFGLLIWVTHAGIVIWGLEAARWISKILMDEWLSVYKWLELSFTVMKNFLTEQLNGQLRFVEVLKHESIWVRKCVFFSKCLFFSGCPLVTQHTDLLNDKSLFLIVSSNAQISVWRPLGVMQLAFD